MTSVETILDLISSLSEEQRAELDEKLTQPPKSKVSAAVVRRRKGPARMIDCPHCSSPLVKKFGSFHGRQKYKCGICGKTFTQLTNTPIAKTRYPEKWDRFVGYCVEGLSLRKIASKLEINVATAFSWRHKLMRAYASNQRLTGIAEADETFFLHSDKGNRFISKVRKPRKRGGTAKTAGISTDQVPVVVGKDRDGNLIVGVAGRGRVSARDIEQVLNEHIDPKAILCTDAHPSFKAFARANNIKCIQLNISKGKRVLRKKYHIQNVNSAHSSIKRWMTKFNGVSTKYLQNYMNWFCLLEETKELPNQSRVFAQKTIHPAISEHGRI